jgi:hypothetical protein
MYGAHHANHENHERRKSSKSVHQFDVCFRSIRNEKATNHAKIGDRTECKAEKNYVDGTA